MKLLTATAVAEICHAAQAGKPWAAANCEGVSGNNWADFVWMIDNAMEGRVIHAPAEQAQLQHFTCIGHLDGAPVFEHIPAPEIDEDDWAAIVD